MPRLPVLSSVMLLSIAACTVADPVPTEQGHAMVTDSAPLEILPANVGIREIRNDLLATAADRFGQDALAQALAAPAHLIAKRFAGRAPPAPPGAGPDWRPPTPASLMMKGPQGWMVATSAGWRPADPAAAADIERLIANPAFWSEAQDGVPCPDYGAGLLLLTVPGRPEVVRNTGCPNVTDRGVRAALAA